MRKFSVFLFDIDGVLVDPRGYRAAVRSTLGYFFQQMGLAEELLPDEDVLSGFEAIRITSEWDMVPICLAAAIDSWLSVNPGSGLPGTLPQALRLISQAVPPACQPASIDYLRILRWLRDRLPAGVYPAETVLDLARNGHSEPIFVHLNNSELLEDLLGHTREVERSLTTRVFQNYTLGSAAFHTSYQHPPVIETPSLLASLDQPRLSEELSRQIRALQAQGKLYPAAFTMRPSLGPRGADDHPPLHYVPEAEIALEIVGLADIPLIGYGRILYLANQLNLEPETLLKPSPVQAIAAIFAAISGDEILGLQTAYNVYAKNAAVPDRVLQGGDQLFVHVFEDSSGGIESVQRAVARLAQSGIKTSLSAWGIADHPEKIAALKSTGASLFAATEPAVRQAINSL